VFIACMLAGGTAWRLAALATFCVASATDVLDGRLARSRWLVTDFGKIADPVADKPLTGVVVTLVTGVDYVQQAMRLRHSEPAAGQ
jgi:phosphatidylglycerophosphate synthase